MDKYMQNRLTEFHIKGVKSKLLSRIVVAFGSLFLVFIIPYIHLGLIYIIWTWDKPPVNRATCTCDCFDTVFRGKYEWPPSSYKHIYFNSTSSTLYIWLIIILGVIGLYEATTHVLQLMMRKQIRREMLMLFLSSIYPHYYGWWGLIGYINDGFYTQWRHQVFFTLTEVISTLLVLHLCDAGNRIAAYQLLLIFNLNLIHILVAGFDQFVVNVLWVKGESFEIMRDVGLMLPDLFHCLMCYFEADMLAERRNISILKLFYKEELIGSVVLVLFVSVLGASL